MHLERFSERSIGSSVLSSEHSSHPSGRGQDARWPGQVFVACPPRPLAARQDPLIISKHLISTSFGEGKEAGEAVAPLGMAHAPRGAMHAIFFGMKRAFHASLRVMRRPLESFGLTVARCDMLWCIFQLETGEDEYPVLQSDVRKKLGVTAPTVTRMMRSLEALGLVRRERDRFDRRQIAVTLTREGLRRIRAAYAAFVERKAAERAIGDALRDERRLGERSSDEQAASSAMGRLGELLGRIRKGFGDRADLQYLWLWDDPRAWLAHGHGSGIRDSA